MPAISAGLLMFRERNHELEVLLVHPGGPWWRNKDHGAWTIPKGEPAAGEDLLRAAQREFEEETGVPPDGPYLPLGKVRQRGGKTVHAWAFRGDLDVGGIQSNTFRMEWPPGSGKFQDFPEIDRACFFGMGAARGKINAAQVPLLDALVRQFGGSP